MSKMAEIGSLTSLHRPEDLTLPDPTLGKPSSLPDDIFLPICRHLHDARNVHTLLALQRTCNVGRQAATQFIYRDIHIKDDGQSQSLLDIFASQDSDGIPRTSNSDGLLQRVPTDDVSTSDPASDSSPNATRSQIRLLRACTYTRSLTIDEFPSSRSCELATAARNLAHQVTGRDLLFPNAHTLCIAANATYIYRNNYIEWRRSVSEADTRPYLSKETGLNAFINPRQLCITRPRTAGEHPVNMLYLRDNLATRAFGFLVYCLTNIFPNLKMVSLHEIIPGLDHEFDIPRCDTRIFVSAGDESPSRDSHSPYAIALNWIYEMIVRYEMIVKLE